MDTQEDPMELSEFFAANPQVAVAFSGGVDSAYLLYEAARHGARVKAYFVKTAFQPDFESADGEKLARQLGVELEILPVEVLCRREIVENGPRRCYFCKTALFQALIAKAQADGFSLVVDGTNASDQVADRPGMQALAELGVRSPLRECGLSKAEIRERSRRAGLFTADKPAYACLATRIPTEEEITEEKLARTQWAETYLHQLGLRDFRVRLCQDLARIQVRQEDIPLVLEQREAINAYLTERYRGVVLDLEVRHGI